MLKLSKNDFTPMGNFKDYAELCDHIRDLENLKLVTGHSQFAQPKWSFMFLPWDRVLELYTILKKEYDLDTLSRALMEGSGIIEMCEGDERDLHLIVASPEIDVEGFQKDFCDDYCHAHDLVITECD